MRLQGGGLAGEIVGVVSSLGLLYTTFSDGENQIMVPNNVVLIVAVIPLHEPAGVDLRARLRPGVTPVDIETLLRETIDTPMRDKPRVALEEIDGDEIVVRIGVSPRGPDRGRAALLRGPRTPSPPRRAAPKRQSKARRATRSPPRRAAREAA